MSAYSNHRYLASKKTVDDRALNKNVFGRLRSEIVSSEKARLSVLEVGGGLGTMVARLVEWGMLHGADYRLLDVDGDLLADARAWLATWAASRGYAVEPTADTVRFHGEGIDVRVTFVQAELGEYLASGGGPPADLLVTNAFLDLVDVPNVLPPLLRLVVPGGLFWFPVNFDGETIFEPPHPDDALLMRIYHRSMDQRVRYGRPAGDSRTGRHLFRHLAGAGATVLAAGGSDWVVHATGGRYEADEEYFLHHIVHTIDQELERHSEIDPRTLARWVELRHGQARRGELVYIAHQLDFAGRSSVRSAP
jgi:hypothetical protein